MRERDGWLNRVLELLLLTAALGWLERRFGFGRGCSCTGRGCGTVLLLVFLILLCGTLSGIDWHRLGFGGRY